MWYANLQHHRPYNHWSKFQVPCRVKLEKWSLKNAKCIEKVLCIHTDEDEEYTEIDKLNDTNSQHGFENNLLIVSGFTNILRSETDDDFDANVNHADCNHYHFANKLLLWYQIEP